MGDEIEKEADQVILDADPVETVALTYDSECIPVKYQKIGRDAHTPRRGSAQAAGYDVYSALSAEIPQRNGSISYQHSHKTRTRLVSEIIQQVQSRCKQLDFHPWSTNGHRQRLPRNYYGSTSQFFEKQSTLGEERRSIAQILIERCYKIYWDHNENLQETEPTARGSGGFGSTGR